MRRFIAVSALCVALGGFSGAAVDVINHRQAYANLLQAPTGAGGPFTPSCSQSTAWFARIAAPGAPYNTAYDTMICGLVTDGVWATLDALWIPAAPNTTDALLNLVSTSFSPMTVHGSPAWSATGGYTGTENNPATDYLDTNYPLASSGVHFTVNAAHFSLWSLTNHQQTTTAAGRLFGLFDSTPEGNTFIPWYTDGSTYWNINSLNSAHGIASVGHSNGSWVINRDGVSTSELYNNGAPITPTTPEGSAVSLLVGQNPYVLAYNAGTSNATDGAALQVPAISIGGSLTAAQVSSLGSTPVTASNAAGATGLVPRICRYLVAIGRSACNS